MKNKLGITAALTGLLLASAAISAPMGSIPIPATSTFDVIRKGKDIGDYSLRFSPKGDGVTVSVRTNIAVKVPVIGVSAYRFEQTSTESWNGSKLQALSSRTNDNGKAHDIHVGPSPLIPASLVERRDRQAAQGAEHDRFQHGYGSRCAIWAATASRPAMARSARPITRSRAG